MNMDNERSRTIEAKIERLRQRVKNLKRGSPLWSQTLDILLGILDLLGDEL